MKWPDRPIGAVAAHCTHLLGRKVTEHIVLLGIGLKLRSEKGLTLSDACDSLAYTRAYGRRISNMFSISFRDFTPAKPLDLPLE